MNLHFEASGSGSVPLVCVHGWACEGGQFKELAGLLEEQFRVFRLDLPGHGRTPLDGFTPGFDSYAEAIADFIAEQGLERPVLLGHSMGGALALMAAALGRFETRAVINLDGSLPPARKVLAAQGVIRGWLKESNFRERLAGVIREAFFLARERDERCEVITREMCAAPDAVLHFLPEQIGDLQAEQILPKVSAPVLYIGAAVPRFDAEEAAKWVPHFHLTRMAKTGHFLHIYGAQEVAELVTAFISKIQN